MNLIFFSVMLLSIITLMECVQAQRSIKEIMEVGLSGKTSRGAEM